MTSQTLNAPHTRSISERLADTALDPVEGRKREYRVIFALTFIVLVTVFALARLFTFLGPAPTGRRSVLQEARSATLAALPYAYRH
ncbi:MAG: hypothetical protein AAGD34_11405 [Pseudomonadota bacterium]